MAAAGVVLNHIARSSPDVKRLADFYQEVLGFERIDPPKFGEFEVIWLRLPPSLSLHLIERDPKSKLAEVPSTVLDPSALPRGHHISFGVSNYDAFVQSLKEKGIRTFETTQPDGKTKQVFFFDPDGEFISQIVNWDCIFTICNLLLHCFYGFLYLSSVREEIKHTG